MRLEFKYMDKEGVNRKMLSIRLPMALLKRLEEIAESKGRDRTEIIQFALDQFCQMENKNK